MPESLLRWPTVDRGDDRVPRLFEPAVNKEFGRGEFRGMEFLHVQAKTIINEVPAASRMPFRYTVNVYRGCSHACSYCLVGDTPILMADGRPKPLADVRVGDEIYGTVGRGTHRRYVITPVLAHWSTVKPAYRLRLEDGTELITSGDHRFLTERGWKHVTGGRQGKWRRPHLTSSDELMATGRFATAPVVERDYRRGYLCGLIGGDGHLGSHSQPRPGRAHEDVRRSRRALADLEAFRRAREYLMESDVITDEFSEAVGAERPISAMLTPSPGRAAAISEINSWPDDPSIEWHKGFLAGMFDAEGSYTDGDLRFSHADQGIIDQIASCLRTLGFSAAIGRSPGRRPVGHVRVRGGLRDRLRFLHTVDPAVARKRSIDGEALESDARLGVVSVEPLGFELPLFDMTTGTGDFIADGVVSHNCFARPTHEYLGLNGGEDFERRIVVKVNAAQLLRAETEPGRWSGDHIAMGTNTDPYQRCEAKYRLTRGVVEVLAERANPFSILTKNTLVLGDLELLAEAAGRAEVAVNLSIGTLDESVWRMSEPNTPHPRKRVEAVARLNEAGVPSGVLIAPVLPGLSDHPDQVAEVVEACLDAGARFVSPILLHLRPGVKEQFMPWLSEVRPDLVPRYRRLYPKSYAPKSAEHELTELVDRLAGERGGRRRLSDTRNVGERREPTTTPGEQLRLGF